MKTKQFIKKMLTVLLCMSLLSGLYVCAGATDEPAAGTYDESILEDIELRIEKLEERVAALELENSELRAQLALLTVNGGDNAAAADTEAYGAISGNVTYFYNDFKGNVADTDSLVFLFPKDGSASDAPQLDSYVLWTMTSIVEETYAEYNIFCTKVDGTGQYVIQNVPAGEYVVFIWSDNVTTKYAFDDRENFEKGIQANLSEYIGAENAADIAKCIGFNSYHVESVTIRENQNYVLSYDFGMTYI